MSITLGIYDVFSYAIPGMLYLFTFNEVFRLLGQPYLSVDLLKDSTLPIFLGLLSYIVGHLFDYISHEQWYRRIYPSGNAIGRAYARFKNIPGVQADFDIEQWPVLFSVVRKINLEHAGTIDRTKAMAIMLRNISFALALLALVSLINAFAHGIDILSLVGFIGASAGSYAAIRRSDSFNVWFYLMIFEQGFLYGNNMEEVIQNTKPHPDQPAGMSPQTRRKRKPEED